MREAARWAGLSQSAPKHHFGDARGLLGALATRAYRELCERLEAVPLIGRGTRERVTALSAEYVAFAGENRALFDLMWRMSQFDVDNPELMEQKHHALRALDRGLRGPDAQLPNGADPALLPSYTVWSLAHGYATLALEGAIDYDGADPATSDLLPAMLRLLDVWPNGDD
jgi:AcrR family transcriptional regulator